MGGGSVRSKESYRDHNRDRQRSYRSYSNNRRSTDYNYRTEDTQKNEDSDYSERKYRSHSEYSNEYRDRDRRSRSRSPERDYDKYDERDNHSSFKEKKEVPNSTLMIRNLPPHITDKDVSLEINKFGLFPKDIRLMKNKETGQSRGFAFIEFASLEQAIQLKEITKGYILIDAEHECSLRFSFPKETHSIDKNILKNDWCCPKCGINNFKRRDECFKCGTTKEEFDLCEATNQKIQQPTNVLMLRNLSISTTEEKILSAIGMISSMPIKSIRIAQDEVDSKKNLCSIELHSVYEATQLSSIISSISDGFVIDNNNVMLTYGKRLDQSLTSATSTASQNAAMAALAAAQWKNLDDSSNKIIEKEGLGKLNINGIEYIKYDFPNYTSFILDTTSGYYYDSSTGFFYDSKSQYFYNSQTQKYMYYDNINQIYIPVNSSGQANNSQSISIEFTKKQTEINEDCTKQDKVKIAKKIAKDMEKWAKTLNQKKEITKVIPQTPSDLDEFPTADSSYYLAEKQMSTIEPSIASNFIKDPFEIIKEEEERLTDLNRMACLLCKRQFNSSELLVKHQELSELHKTNLSALRQTLLNLEQLEHVEKIEREMAYRDRAQERRSKYGIDDTPEYSKKKYNNQRKELPKTISEPAMPISNENIGSKMLKAMGWTEGKGLGKSNQGISNIIEVERRKSGIGLGNSNASPLSSSKETYKDAVRRTAFERFKQLSDE